MNRNHLRHHAPISLLISFLLIRNAVSAQFRDTTFHVQYPAKGFVLLNSGKKVSIKGLNYANSDSLILFERSTPSPSIKVYKNISSLTNVRPRVEAIADIKLLKDNRNAAVKGASAGAVLGFGLGYLVGYGSYKDRLNRTREENDDRMRTRAGMYGLLGAVPVGLTGALIGRVILRKRFTIEGDKERLINVLEKIYR